MFKFKWLISFLLLKSSVIYDSAVWSVSVAGGSPDSLCRRRAARSQPNTSCQLCPVREWRSAARSQGGSEGRRNTLSPVWAAAGDGQGYKPFWGVGFFGRDSDDLSTEGGGGHQIGQLNVRSVWYRDVGWNRWTFKTPVSWNKCRDTVASQQNGANVTDVDLNMFGIQLIKH